MNSHQLPSGIHCTKFGNFQARGTCKTDIKMTSLGLQNDRLKGAKQYSPFFQRKVSRFVLKMKPSYGKQVLHNNLWWESYKTCYIYRW